MNGNAQKATVWLCRHAETAVPGVFHGAESDVGLSEKGFRQVQAAAEWFQSISPHIVISSKMLRARLTAETIASRCAVPHVIAANLQERRVGSLGGTPYLHAESPWLETVKQWTAGNTSFTTPGAESYVELVERIIPAFEKAIEPYHGQNVALIVHGIVCKILLLTLIDGLGPGKWGEVGNIYNLSTAELVRENDGPWQLRQRPFLPPPVQLVNDGRSESKW